MTKFIDTPAACVLPDMTLGFIGGIAAVAWGAFGPSLSPLPGCASPTGLEPQRGGVM